MSNALNDQMLRGFRGALRTAALVLTWTRDVPAAPVTFSAIKNPIPKTADGIDRNPGDNAPCILTATVEDLPTDLPEQGDTFTDAAGLGYRIASIERTPGHPLIHFTIEHVAPATFPA